MPDHEFSGVFGDFLATNFEHNPKLTNLADLIAWNQAHAEEAMPERRETQHPAPPPPPRSAWMTRLTASPSGIAYTKQTELVKCLHDSMTPERRDAAVAAIRRIALEEGMAKYM